MDENQAKMFVKKIQNLKLNQGHRQGEQEGRTDASIAQLRTLITKESLLGISGVPRALVIAALRSKLRQIGCTQEQENAFINDEFIPFVDKKTRY